MKKQILLVALGMMSSLALAKGGFEELQGNPVLSSAHGSSGYMECFVDTPAWDDFRPGGCMSVGWRRKTTAVFRVQGGADTNFRIYWSHSACSQTSKTCFVPISQYQAITVSADVLDLSNSSFFTVSATARYEGLD